MPTDCQVYYSEEEAEAAIREHTGYPSYDAIVAAQYLNAEREIPSGLLKGITGDELERLLEEHGEMEDLVMYVVEVDLERPNRHQSVA